MFDFVKKIWDKKDEPELQPPSLSLTVTKLMVGMMIMDGRIDDKEHEEIIRQLQQRFGLSRSEGDRLIKKAMDKGEPEIRFEYLVRRLNEEFTVDERVAFLTEMWRIAHADGHIDFLEEQYLNRLSGLVGVPPNRLREAKEAANPQP